MILLAWLILFRARPKPLAPDYRDETDVYESPPYFARLGKVHGGDAVEASNVPLQGFYKVKTAAGSSAICRWNTNSKLPRRASSGSARARWVRIDRES